MPEMITGKKTQQYSTEFKVKAVEWSHQAHRSVKSVAEALDIHPFMLSRWRREYREGKFTMKRVKKAPADAKKKIQEQDEIARLKRRVSELQEENDILKKFGYTDLMVDGAPSPHQSDTTLRWLIDRLRS
ncbi:transposase [Tepidiphilus margaritifer]|uniref:transposase n=1 Tax=Tepidiphilus margaritifer TaxID=203471 RepID=UPI00042A50A1|nr:transposase [Tepidiphilus margaritifer]